MHTLCPTPLPAVQLPPACTACTSPYSTKKHVQLSLTLFSSFTCSPPIPTLSLVPQFTALLSLLCFFGALFPLLPRLLLPPDCVQPWHTGVTDLYTPPHSSSQPVCRRANGFMKEDSHLGPRGKPYCPLWHLGLQLAQSSITNLQ